MMIVEGVRVCLDSVKMRSVSAVVLNGEMLVFCCSLPPLSLHPFEVCI